MVIAVGTTDDIRSSRDVMSLHPEQVEDDRTSALGMVAFLASWAMLFSGLFFAFSMVRVDAPIWPPAGYDPLPLVLPGINTGVIVLSSILLLFAGAAVRRDQSTRAIQWLVGTIVLGTLFLALQWVVWSSLWEGGLRLDSGRYGSYFYLLTAFHGLHVVVGLGLLAWLVAVLRGPETPKRAIRTKMVAMFWHFVGIVWVLLFGLIYVL